MNRNYSRPVRPIPRRRLAGLSDAPPWLTGSNWTPGPMAAPPPMPGVSPQPSPCDPCGKPCAEYVVDTLRPFNPQPGGFALLALLAGGVIGYFIGKGA
jgi:hypothetical protein